MLSFKVKGGEEEALNFFKKIKVFTLAKSLGGVKSITQYPIKMSHGKVCPIFTAKLGIDEKFIRVSVGCEETVEILHDVDQALSMD